MTTNSQDGVLDIEQYYPVFEAMQAHDLVLNLHGETPEIEILQAEAAFVPTLHRLHAAFPKLRIVLEHVSTAQGVEAVRKCGATVAATITAHHLFMTTENAEQDVYNFCKPIAKTLEDRIALLRAAVDGSGKFFFGSDSAPHPVQLKEGTNAAAGCFTQGERTLGLNESGPARRTPRVECRSQTRSTPKSSLVAVLIPLLETC